MATKEIKKNPQPEGPLQEYAFVELGFVVEAHSQAEAQELAKKKLEEKK